MPNGILSPNLTVKAGFYISHAPIIYRKDLSKIEMLSMNFYYNFELVVLYSGTHIVLVAHRYGGIYYFSTRYFLVEPLEFRYSFEIVNVWTKG